MPVTVWVWQAGQTPDGSPVLDKRLPEDGFAPPQGAWLAEQDEAAWRDEIMAELAELDIKSIRALREGNAERIAEIEARAELLRGTLRRL